MFQNRFISSIVILTLIHLSQNIFCQNTRQFNNSRTINSQDYTKYELSYYTGIGTYTMTDMKMLQTKNVPPILPMVINSNFPPYLTFAIKFGQHIDNKHVLGISAELMSTGAKSSLSDYSGIIFSQIKCVGFSFGGYYKSIISSTQFKKKNIDWGYQIEAGALASAVRLTDQFTLYNTDYNQSDNYSLTSYGGYLTPSLFSRFNLNHKFDIEVDCGYMLNLNSTLQLSDDENAKLTINGKDYKTNWSGFRAKLGFIWNFN